MSEKKIMKKVGIVLPCYNEAKGAKENIIKIQDYCKSISDYSFIYIPVNDGSKDNTKEVLESVEGVEVVSYDNLVAYGGYNQAREAGKVRSEGKDYVVQDGDVILFKFNV